MLNLGTGGIERGGGDVGLLEGIDGVGIGADRTKGHEGRGIGSVS